MRLAARERARHRVVLPITLTTGDNSAIIGVMERLCLYCHNKIDESRLKRFPNTLVCKQECMQLYKRQQYYLKNPKPELPLFPATTGVISEYRVAIDLLKKNYEVFRAVSPSCSCDLAILKDGKILRVEVKTGHRTPIGAVYALNGKMDKADILAVVLPEEIIYKPDLPT